MKFTILKEELRKALSIVGRAINGKNVRQILNGIKMELNEKGLFLTASDSNISIVTKVPLQREGIQIINIFEEGSCVIVANKITDLVRNYIGDRIEFELIENNVLKVINSTNDFDLNCMPVDDYPILDFDFSGSHFDMDANSFVKAIDQTSYAASTADVRVILQGVNMTGKGNNIEWTASDCITISKKIIHIDQEVNFSVTVPAKTLNEVARIADGNEKITILISEKKIIFRLSNTLIAAGIINSPYPSTSRFFKDSYQSKLEVDRSELIAQIETVAVLGDSQDTYVRFEMSENEVNIMARTQKVGSGKIKLTKFDYSGERCAIPFTTKSILDCVKAIGGEKITIYFNGDNEPVVVKSKSDDSVMALVQCSTSW